LFCTIVAICGGGSLIPGREADRLVSVKLSVVAICGGSLIPGGEDGRSTIGIISFGLLV